MPTFRYTAKDPRGRTVGGQIDAADLAAARALLAADDLQVGQIEPAATHGEQEPGNQGDQRRDRDADTAELTDHIAALANADLPLAPGLRALAEQLAASPLKRDVRELADRLEAGVPLTDALDAQKHGVPQYLRGAIAAGLRTGTLGSVIEEMALQQQANREVVASVWMAMAYPLFVLGLLLLMVLAAASWIVPLFADIFSDFELALPALTKTVIAISAPQWPLLLLILLLVFGGLVALELWRPAWVPTRLLRAIPLVGPLWGWSGMTEVCRLLGTLLRFDIPLPEALRLTADGVRDPGIGTACRKLADQVERGQSLAAAVGRARLFPASLTALIQWGQQVGSLPKALLMAGDIYADRVQYQAIFLRTILPPILLIVILIAAGLLVAALMLPLVKLIEGLT